MKTMKRLETVLILGVVFQGIAFGGESVTQTGDVMVLAGKQLVMDNSKLVQDAAGTGGEAVESGGKAWYVVHVATPKIPAGRYRVTARIEVLKREAACHVGRLIVNSDTGDKVDDVTLPFGTENFEKAAVYKDFSVELVRPPSDKGKLSLLVRILHETPAVPVRVASIEIKALAIPPVLVHRVWPQKLLARCNADQPITVSVCNLTDQPQEALKLKLDLIYGLNEVCTVGTKDLSLKPYETVEAIFPWKTGEREYGYEARATVVDSKGGAISQHSDYFAVSRSHFKLRILGSPRRRVYFPDKNASVQAAAYLRETYGNYLEVYGWAPSAFVELYPRHRFWTSGQVSVWWYDRDAMKAWIDEMHRLGMWVTAYDISLFNGWPGQETMRKHPEWCAFNALGRPRGGVNTAYWQTQANAYNDTQKPDIMPFAGEMPNNGSIWPMDDSLIKKAAEEILLIHRNLGFDGVRWDGHPIVYVLKEKGGVIGTDFGKMIWNHEGKKITELIPGGDMDRQSLHNVRLIKETVRKEAPEFEWGYNAGYDLTAKQQPKTWKEVSNNAGIWVEGGFRSGDEGKADPSNTWAKYMDRLFLSCQFVIRSGGYPIHGALSADSSIMRRFMNGIFFAQGSHVAWHGGSWGEYVDMSRFATRYSQYLFDPRIHPWWGYPDIQVTGWVQWEDRNPACKTAITEEAVIKSPRPVFFPEKFLFHRDVSKTEVDTILHLFNDPGKPYVDYMEMTAPPVQENLAVSLKIPKGMKPKQAMCLSPDAWPMETPLTVSPAEKGWIAVTVPRLAAWDVVVVNWQKE